MLFKINRPSVLEPIWIFRETDWKTELSLNPHNTSRHWCQALVTTEERTETHYY